METTFHKNDFYINKQEKWYNNQGKLDRGDDLPAVINYYKNDGGRFSEQWFKNGVRHRDSQLIDGKTIDLPAFIMYYKNEKKRREDWWKNGRHEKIITYNYKFSDFYVGEDGRKNFVKCETEVWELAEGF